MIRVVLAITLDEPLVQLVEIVQSVALEESERDGDEPKANLVEVRPVVAPQYLGQPCILAEIAGQLAVSERSAFQNATRGAHI